MSHSFTSCLLENIRGPDGFEVTLKLYFKGEFYIPIYSAGDIKDRHLQRRYNRYLEVCDYGVV